MMSEIAPRTRRRALRGRMENLRCSVKDISNVMEVGEIQFNV
jgi:hypothetical protein